MNLEAVNKLANDIEDGYIQEDKYGDPLAVIPIDEFIEALEESHKLDPYRRFAWALALLKSIQSSWDYEDRLFVVTYAH